VRDSISAAPAEKSETNPILPTLREAEAPTMSELRQCGIANSGSSLEISDFGRRSGLAQRLLN
jgi:hypothetical protein